MTFFSDRELAGLTAMDQAAMQDVVTIIYVTSSTDAGGAYTEATTSGTTIGRLRKRGGAERYTDRQVERGTYELVLPRDTTIASTDRVMVNGQAYRIVFRPVLVAYDTALRIGLEEA